MKFCPQCKTGFHDHAETCPTHGVYLSEIIDLKPGMLIRNTYRIIRKLGEGAFGAVYLADQTLMDEPRAVKFLSRQWSLDEAFTARFRREVRTLRQLRHRNVVDCGDLERAEDDSLFFSMEFVDGPDLRDFLSHAPRPFGVQLALEIARGIAEGLGAAHAKGIVHRDIKPENILLARTEGGYIPKIADFGIVATKESSTTHTRIGGTLLTMNYAAPEQWRGTSSSELDGRTDLYALGGVLFEMLADQTVFKADSYEGWAMQHLSAAPRPPSVLRPELVNWKGLDALALRLLAKNPDDRPKDVAEVLRLLDAVRYVAPAQRQRTVVENPTAQYATTVEPVNPTPKRRAGRFPRWAWGTVAALVLTAAGVATWLSATGPVIHPPANDGAPVGSFAKQHSKPPIPAIDAGPAGSDNRQSTQAAPSKKKGVLLWENPEAGSSSNSEMGKRAEIAEGLQRADAKHKSGDNDGAIEAYDAVLRLDPNNRTARQNKEEISNQLIQQGLQRADSKFKSGDDGGALEAYNGVLLLNPKNQSARDGKEEVLKDCRLQGITCNPK